MARTSQPDQYVFTFDANGVATTVAEVERNGRLDYERIDRDESYRLIDGFVVKTEVDGRDQEWEVYADTDGDGRWVEVGEGDGVFTNALLDRFKPGAAPTAPVDDDVYLFFFDALGAVTAVYEREDNGRFEREGIDRDESYALINGLVVKTEFDDGQVELTYYADPEADGLWIQAAQPTGLW